MSKRMLVCLLLLLGVPAALAARRAPGLGQFVSPVSTTVTAGPTAYSAVGNLTFTPVTTPQGLRYNVSGQVLLTRVGPPPPPPPKDRTFRKGANR